MSWIESHQELREHPKTKRLCRLLGIPRPMAVGYLHFLWWWAYDYAAEGDLSAFTDEDIADAIDWEGDPTALVGALTQAGFVDEGRRIHDWEDFAQKWIDRRRADRERKRAGRRKPEEVSETSDGTEPEICSPSGVTGPYRTLPDLTGLNPPLASQEPPSGGNGADAPPSPKPERSKASKSSGKTSPPESLEPTDTEYRLGETVGLTRGQVDLAVGAMLDHFRSKGEQRADWRATLRTWIRNSPSFDPPARASPSSRNDREPSIYGELVGVEGIRT